MVHGDVLEGQIAQVTAAIAVGLDADSLVSPVKTHTLCMNGLHTGGSVPAPVTADPRTAVGSAAGSARRAWPRPGAAGFVFGAAPAACR
jgi:hypothetical protein